MANYKLAVGLDIGSSSVKLCQLKRTKKGYQLHSFAVAPLPPEAIVDGAIMNAAAIVDAISEMVSSHKLRTKEVATSVSGHSVIIKKISLPHMTPTELEESLKWEAEQYIPFDINDVHIDSQILTTENTQVGQMDVLLVAAKKDMITDYTSVISEAGLTPMVVDVDAFAVQNAFEVNYELPNRETVAIINIGAQVVNINVIANGLSSFTRHISMGGNQITEEIQKQLNVSYDEAEGLKLGNSADPDAIIPQEVDRIIQSVADSLATEVQRSLDFYAATTADSQITKIYLAGGTARTPAILQAIEARTGISAEVLNPFRNIDCDTRGFDQEYLRTIGPVAAVSVGLALRGANDRQ